MRDGKLFIAFPSEKNEGEEKRMNQIFSAKCIKSRRYHKYCEMEFHRRFFLSGQIACAELSLTSHGVFAAALNGTRIGKDVLAPGWTVYDKRLQYLTYDVTALLRQGENRLAVGVGRGWLFHGVKEWGGFGLKPDEAALLCALTLRYKDGREEVIFSDESWVTRRGHVIYNDIYNGETLDLAGRNGTFSPAVTVRYPKNMLIPAEGEPICEMERIPGQKLIVTPKGEKVIDFGQEVTGYVSFSADAPKGTEICLRHFEVLDREGNVYTENLRGARAVFTVISGGTPFTVKPKYTFYGFRYLHVTGIENVDPADFTAVVVHSDMRRTSSFACAEPLLNQFAHNVLWGQKGNFLDVPTDCPQRDERLGWTGDAEVFSRTAAINFDVRKFFDKWLADLEADQRADGAIPHVCPYPWNRKSYNYASPAWADAAVIIPWELYMAYGDVSRLRRNFPLMKKWVEHMIGCCRTLGEKAGREFGHPWTTDGFGDWLDLVDINNESGSGVTDRGMLATAYLLYDLTLLIKTCRILGEPADYYEHVYSDALSFFRGEYMENGRMKQDTQTAEVVALIFGLTDDPAETGRQLTENVRKNGRLTTGFIGSTYLLDALTLAGEDALAVDLLLKKDYPSWLYPVTMGATTVWERWNGIFPDGRFADKNMNSFNHYAYGSVFSWMFTRLAGIRPVEEKPGYEKIMFAPAPDQRIPWVKASLETDRGTVSSDYEKTENGWRFTFTVPAGSSAEAELFGVRYPLHTGKNEICVSENAK